MNEALLFVEIAVVFGMILLFKRFLGASGLFAWIGIAAIIANVELVKGVNIFGLSATLGNVMFASVFLATDILSECYGEKEAKKGVYVGLFSVIAFIVCTQIALLFVPNELDFAHEPMKELFSITPRVCASSVLMFFLANIADVFLYNKLKVAFGGKKMWLRNNLSTIVCNCLDNFGLMFLAFYGVYPVKELLIISLTSCFIEIIIALFDTPFLYLAKGKQEYTEAIYNK